MALLRRALAHRVSLAVVAFVSATVIAACGGSDLPQDAAPQSTTAQDTPPHRAGGFPRTVTHAMGETSIERQPQRVVVLDTPEAGAVTLVGMKPVGAVSVDPVNNTYPAHLRDELAGVPDVGPLEEPNLEKILSLQPDLILSSKVRHEQIYGQLSQIAPTVLAESPGAGWKENIGLFAQALGKEKEAADAIKAYQDRARRIGEAIQAKHNGTMPTVSIVRFVDGPTRLYLPSSFSGVVVGDTGLRRPPSQQDPQKVIQEIGPEQIGQADADYIFVTTYGDPARTQQNAVLAGPLWAQLNAVKNNRAVTVSDDTWMTGIGIQGAHLILDDIAKAAGVGPQR